MSIYYLGEQLQFPDPSEADAEGLLAVGGDLSPQRLLLAYASGIFPWFTEQNHPFWFSPDPRCVLFPEKLHVSASMKHLLQKKRFTVTLDTDFLSVIKGCATVKRKQSDGSWITPDFISAYLQLHEMGFAHSVEVWENGSLAGGLYGVSLGNLFSGESMFSTISNTSKFAFITLVQFLQKKGFTMIDCQVFNPHLATLGAEKIRRDIFLQKLKTALQAETWKGKWSFDQ